MEEELEISKFSSGVWKKVLKVVSKQTTTKLTEDEARLSQLESEVANMSATNDTSIKVYLADQYYLVVGDTFQLFYRSVIRAVDPYGYYLKVTGDKGHSFNRYFEFTPEAAGTFNLTLEVCDSNGAVLGQDSTKLIVADKKKTTNLPWLLLLHWMLFNHF